MKLHWSIWIILFDFWIILKNRKKKKAQCNLEWSIQPQRKETSGWKTTNKCENLWHNKKDKRWSKFIFQQEIQNSPFFLAKFWIIFSLLAFARKKSQKFVWIFHYLMFLAYLIRDERFKLDSLLMEEVISQKKVGNHGLITPFQDLEDSSETRACLKKQLWTVINVQRSTKYVEWAESLSYCIITHGQKKKKHSHTHAPH